MNNPEKASLLHGAAALAVAGITVKIIGAFYKIPLGSMLGPVGMANFSIAYNIYSFLFVIATAGVPTAVSKMIAEAYALHDADYAERVYAVSGRVFSLGGFLGFLALFFFAAPISGIMGSRDAAYAVRAISPAVFFVAVSAVKRGYFQGCSDMYPTAVSEVLEALGKLIFGILAAYILKRHGADIAHISAGAVSGVAVGAFLSCLYFSSGNRRKKTRSGIRKRRGVLRKLLSISFPVTLGAAVISLSALIDSALVLNILQGSGFSELRSKWLFGAYNYATTLFSLPTAIFSTLAAVVVPSLAGCVAEKNTFEADRILNSGVRMSVLVGALSASGMAALSYGIIALLYGNGIENECVEVSAQLLSVISLGTVPLAIVTATNAVHQAMGRAGVPVVSIACGGVVKIISNYILVRIPEINISGAAISTVFCYITAMSVNLSALRQYRGISIELRDSILKPLITGIAVFFVARMVCGVMQSCVDVEIATVIAVLGGGVVGIVLAFFLGNIREDDKKLLFGREKIPKIIENN